MNVTNKEHKTLRHRNAPTKVTKVIISQCIKLLASARNFLGLGKRKKQNKVGRPVIYDDGQLQLAELAMRVFGIPSEKKLTEEMRKDDRIRRFCRLKCIPSRSTLSRRRRKTGIGAKSLFYAAVRKIKELLNWIDNKFSVDSKLFWAYANRKKKTDPDAKWGYCAAKDMFIFGYKIHVITETSTELPVAFVITPANAGDNHAFFFLFRDLGQNFSYEIKKMIGDCGYDDSKIRKLLNGRNIGVCIARNGRGHCETIRPSDPDYALRTTSERVNSRMDCLFGLPDLKLRGLSNVVYHTCMLLTAMLFVAIAGKLNGQGFAEVLPSWNRQRSKWGFNYATP